MNALCRQIRKDILVASRTSGHGHIPSCFSIVDMLFATFACIKHDPGNPACDKRDIFILS